MRRSSHSDRHRWRRPLQPQPDQLIRRWTAASIDPAERAAAAVVANVADRWRIDRRPSTSTTTSSDASAAATAVADDSPRVDADADAAVAAAGDDGGDGGGVEGVDGAAAYRNPC